jgi:hypothetical protein
MLSGRVPAYDSTLAVAAADDPPPPLMTTVGVEVYPDPGPPTTIACTAVPANCAIAVAPLPPPPLMTTSGALV